MPNITGFDACKQALDGLIGQARADLAAKKDGDQAAYDAAVTQWERKFIEFVNSSRPGPGETDAIHELDQQAIRMSTDIRRAQMRDIITVMDARSREIEAAGKEIGKLALSNVDAAKRGRLLPIKNAIDSLTGAVNQIKVLKKDLDASNPDEQKILGEIETLLEKFTAVKSSVSAL